MSCTDLPFGGCPNASSPFRWTAGVHLPCYQVFLDGCSPGFVREDIILHGTCLVDPCIPAPNMPKPAVASHIEPDLDEKFEVSDKVKHS